MTTTTTTTISHVIPWEDMSPLQQAEHLVYAHGYDADFFWSPNVPALSQLSNPDVVDAFLEDKITSEAADGESYPRPADRDYWHCEDHEQYPHGGGLHTRHVHDKPAANPRPKEPTMTTQPRSVVANLSPEAYADLAQTIARQAEVLAAGTHAGPAYALAHLLAGNVATLVAWTADDRA